MSSVITGKGDQIGSVRLEEDVNVEGVVGVRRGRGASF